MLYALLVSVFALQTSLRIPGTGDTREAKMTWACSPWNWPRVAITEMIGCLPSHIRLPTKCTQC